MKEVVPIRNNDFSKDHASRLEKIREATGSTLPIILIVILLTLTIVPVPNGLMLSFLVGAVMVVVGMGLFTLGAETSMTPIGTRIGASLTASRNLPLILLVSFALGIAVTVAEPDLQVLAETVPHIDNMVLLLAVGVGVGLFLALCMVRILFGIRLRWLLLICYIGIFILAAFADPNFLAVGFDSGGVTTGPMTVPFILALGVGVSHIRSDSKSEADNFGLVALCSVGPILAVLLLGFFYQGEGTTTAAAVADWSNTAEIGRAYLMALPKYAREMAVALAPIVVIFFLFQWITLHLPRRVLLRICMGILYTYAGLILFLTGVNIGFSSLGTVLGAELVAGWTKYLTVPLAGLMGWFIISAEPAVYVLEQQIEEISAGTIPGKAIKISLSVAVSLAMALAMVRVLTGISILWFLVPGYAVALMLTFFVPDLYTAIAFDSGGVASGPMTATFMLQFMMGASDALGGNPLRDAFGIVALVAMMPLISIQVMGFLYGRKAKSRGVVLYQDNEIIELWEEATV